MADPVGLLAARGKKGNHFGSNQAGGTGNEQRHTINLWARQGQVGKRRISTLVRYGPAED